MRMCLACVCLWKNTAYIAMQRDGHRMPHRAVFDKPGRSPTKDPQKIPPLPRRRAAPGIVKKILTSSKKKIVKIPEHAKSSDFWYFCDQNGLGLHTACPNRTHYANFSLWCKNEPKANHSNPCLYNSSFRDEPPMKNYI